MTETGWFSSIESFSSWGWGLSEVEKELNEDSRRKIIRIDEREDWGKSSSLVRVSSIVHLSPLPFNVPWSTKICSSLVMKTLTGEKRSGLMDVVGLPVVFFCQIRSWSLSPYGTTMVFLVVMNRIYGLEPTTVRLAKLVTSEFHVALKQNFGWLNDRSRKGRRWFVEVKNDWSWRVEWERIWREKNRR